MNTTIDFVDCKAIEKALYDNLPSNIRVVRVWEGTMRNDNTFKVYAKVTQDNDNYPSFFTEVVLDDMRAICGKLIDVEIMNEYTLEFGFALPLTSHYYLRK